MRRAAHRSGLVASWVVASALGVAVLGSGCGNSSSSTGGYSPGSSGSNGTGTAGTSGTAGASTGGAAGSGTGAGGSGVVPTGSGGATGFAGTSGGAAGTTGTAGTSAGAAGTTGTAGSGNADGGMDASGSCLVTLTSLIPGSFSALEAGPSSVLRVQATVSGSQANADGGATQWVWSVKMAGASSLADLPWTPVDDAGSTIDVALGTPGTYQVQARIAGAPACDRAPLILTVNPPQTPSYRFRVTPPSAAQLPVQEKVVKSTGIAGVPQVLDLGDASSSTVVSLAPVDVRGFPLPSYVRITSPAFAFELEGSTGRGALISPLATSLTYDVLIVPDNGLAPLVVSGTPDSVSTKMAVVPGAIVTGSMHDGLGHVVSGARVALKAGQRPSTVGVSGADGSFTLTTREGSLAATILPPDGSGLPEAHVSATPGIALLAGATSLDLAMTWAKVPAAALTISVRGPGAGGQAVAGARVRADLATPLPNAGTLTVHGASDVQLPATGTAHADGVTDAQGVAQLGLLPTGTYHVIVAPPEDPASAITLADVVLPAAGTSAAIALAAPVTFSGTLKPAGTAGAKVTAIDRGLLAAPTLPTATAGADGTYTLALAPGRTYELLVEPVAATTLARSVVSVVTPSAAGGSGTQAVPSSLLWKGTITGGGRVVAGALVQAYCAAPASSCLDATLAVAQGTTAADGTVTLALPSPSP